MKTLRVPRVTMNGGRRSLVTRKAVESTRRRGRRSGRSERAKTPGTPFSGGGLSDDHRRGRYRCADGEVDAGGQDDEGLRQARGSPTTATCWVISDRFAGKKEPWIDDAEDDDRDHQHDGGADRGVAVQDVAQPAPGECCGRGTPRPGRGVGTLPVRALTVDSCCFGETGQSDPEGGTRRLPGTTLGGGGTIPSRCLLPPRCRSSRRRRPGCP